MRINEFVEETLVQVVESIQEANGRLKSVVAESQLNIFGLAPGMKASEGCGIEFDLAVSTRSLARGEAGSGSALEVVGIKFGGAGSRENENVSRVRFYVSVDQWIRSKGVSVFNKTPPEI